MKSKWNFNIVGFALISVIFVMVVSFVINLVFGNCQNSKWHYLIQEYYLPDSIKNLTVRSKVYIFEEIKIDKNYSGVWIHWNKKGDVLFRGAFKNGKAVGKFEYWYENGQKKSEAYFVEDKVNGKRIKWYENGQLELVDNWINGVPHGAYAMWYESGQKWFTNNHSNGVLNGIWEEWYENGQKKYVKKYLNGVEHGFWERWHENGQIRSKQNWSNGILILSEGWTEQGEMSSKTRYIDEKKQHRIELYSENKLKEVLWRDVK